jgi:GntR family transcriptional regulator
MPTAAQIRLDTISGIPAWRQIVSQLRTLIIEGVLAPGDSLPSVRQIAMDLGIHFNTVAEAYRTLAQDGFLEIVHGHGARVLDRPPKSEAGPELADDFRLKLRELVAETRAQGLNKQKVAYELRRLAEALEKS